LIGSAIHQTMDRVSRANDSAIGSDIFEATWRELLAGRNFREARLDIAEERLERARRFVWSMTRTRPRRTGAVRTEVRLVSGSGKVLGTIDRMRVAASGDTQIFEVKTGVQASALIASYRDQLVSYAYLLSENGGLARRGALLFVLSGGVVRESWTPEEVSAQGALLEETASEVARASIASQGQGRVGDECLRCDYRPWCPAFWSVYRRTRRPSDVTRPLPGAQIHVGGIIRAKDQVLLVDGTDRQRVDLIVDIANYPQSADLEVGSIVRVTDVMTAPLGPLRLRLTKSSELFVVTTRVQPRTTGRDSAV
jgi:RecB family exonuclease